MLALLGLAFTLVSEEISLYFGMVPFCSMHAGFGAALLAILLCPVARDVIDRHMRSGGIALLLAGVAQCLAPTLLAARALGAGSPGESVEALACLLAGMGTALFAVRWFAEYARAERPICCRAALISFALSSLIRLVPGWGTDALQVALLLCAAPVASFAWLTFFQSGDTGGRLSPQLSAIRWAAPATLVILVAMVACALPFAAMRLRIFSFSGGATLTGLGYLIRTVFPLVLLALTHAVTRSNIVVLVVEAPLLLLCGVFGVIFVVDTPSAIVPALVEVERFASVSMFLLISLTSVEDPAVGPSGAISCWLAFRGAYELLLATACAIGSCLLEGTVLGLSKAFSYLAISCMAVVAVAACRRFLLCLAYGCRAGEDACRAGVGGDDAAARRPSLEELCRFTAQTYNLSAREEEILLMTCTGRSKGHIAESLGLAEDTVRWYSKSIYAKLGVHNKQDLLTVVGLR